MTSRLRLLAVAIAAAAILVQPAPASAASRAVEAVTWNVDHARKTITATVRLRIGSACTRGQMARATTQGPAAAKRCKVGPEIAKAIKDNVDAVWNTGHTFGCYKLKIETDIEVVDELVGAVAGSDKTPDNRAYVAIDQSPAGVRSMVSAHGWEDARWDGNTARDAVYPSNGSAAPSTWKYPQTWERSLYAHEVGHVIGLSDHYEEYRGEDGELYSRTRAGAATDVMSNVEVTNVDRKTVMRLVERAGISMYNLKCDYTVDQDVPGGRMTGTKCGGIAGDWRIHMEAKQGPVSVTQDWVVNITSEADASGTFTYESYTHTKVPQSESESWGKSSGSATVTLVGTGRVKMELQETENKTRGRGTAGGRTFTVPWSDAPLVPWDFTWQPTVCPAGG
jgi:hypothetical protein